MKKYDEFNSSPKLFESEFSGFLDFLDLLLMTMSKTFLFKWLDG